MNDVIVTAVNHGCSTFQETTGTEVVLLRFAKVDFSYKAQKPDGSLDAATSFQDDFSANKVP